MIRRIEGPSNSIYLTFDDGPDAVATPQILQIFEKHQAFATFFVVTNRLEGHKKLVEEMLARGHALGNHSLDHDWTNYFRRDISDWITRSEQSMQSAGLSSWVGFRPPAGVVTPPLRRELAKREEPLILWNERFYDSVWPWRAASAVKSARRLVPGSIVLLHDRQKASRVKSFCATLDRYITELKARGFELRPLTRKLCADIHRR